jgi:hypothetical protein
MPAPKVLRRCVSRVVPRWLRPMDAEKIRSTLVGVRGAMGLVPADALCGVRRLPSLCRPADWSGVRCLQAGAWGPSFGLLPRTVLRAPSLRPDACVAATVLVRALHG